MTMLWRLLSDLCLLSGRFLNSKNQIGSLTIYFGLQDPTISWAAPKNPVGQTLVINALSSGYGSHIHLASHIAATWSLLSQDPLIPTETRKPICTAVSPYQLHLPPVVTVSTDRVTQQSFQHSLPCLPVLLGKWITESRDFHYSHTWLCDIVLDSTRK